jgi:type VI protein secretion system component VasK
VAISGIAAVVLVAWIGFLFLPGDIAAGRTDNSSGVIGGAIGAAVAAIGTVVSAYFGIRAANEARQAAQQSTERAQSSNERTQVALTEVAGAASSREVQEGLERSVERLRQLNLL